MKLLQNLFANCKEQHKYPKTTTVTQQSKVLRHRFLASNKFEFKKHLIARRAQWPLLPFNFFRIEKKPDLLTSQLKIINLSQI